MDSLIETKPGATDGSPLRAVSGYLPSLFTAEASGGDEARRRHGCDNSPQAWINNALADLNAAIQEYNPIVVVSLMSGGNDSLPACYVASLHSACNGMLHINTGIGIEATREYVRRLCFERRWELSEYKATENVNAKGEPDPQIYEDFVMQYGFPGPHGHGMMYARLKERQLKRFERDMGADGRANPKRRVMYVSGVRIEESARRGFTTKPCVVQTVNPRSIFVAPIWHWSKAMCAQVRDYAGLPDNPVARELGMSGECLCGAFNKRGELARIRAFDSAVADRIQALEARARAAGHDWGWEDEPPENTIDPDQFELFSTPRIDQHLCRNCIYQHRASLAVADAPATMRAHERGSTNPSTTAQADNVAISDGERKI